MQCHVQPCTPGTAISRTAGSTPAKECTYVCMNKFYSLADRWRQATNGLDASLSITLVRTFASSVTTKVRNVCVSRCQTQSVTFSKLLDKLSEMGGDRDSSGSGLEYLKYRELGEIRERRSKDGVILRGKCKLRDLSFLLLLKNVSVVYHDFF